MQILSHHSLYPFNSFKIKATAKYFSIIDSIESLEDCIEQNKKKVKAPLLILGGGSNILFTKDFDGWVLKNELKGIECIAEDNTFYYIKAMAGEQWHALVMHCVKMGYAGLENLSLIPGNVGASPMQNIGAYGVEIKDVFFELEAYHIAEQKIIRFNNSNCEFGYRESIFKGKLKNQFVIISVTFQLRKKPIFNTSYGAIEKELEQMNIKELSIQSIAYAVIRIRTSKLPDPVIIGNAGSFFKNPVISIHDFNTLKEKFETIPGYIQTDTVKVPAGWLIEQCGWKGFKNGDVGCYQHQALVLVNYGNATGKEVYQLSEEIIQSVQEKFGISLEREVNII